MKILITGATGFIGSHLAKKFIDLGHKVIGITKSGNINNLFSIKDNPNFSLIKTDIIDFKSLKEKIKKENENEQIDIIYHLAAYLPPIENTNLLFDTNVRGTFNLLQITSELKIKKFIYFSSMAVYGDVKYLPVDENHPTNPVNVYGLSKISGENICKFYSGDKLKIIILRCSGVYGPGRNTGAFANFIKKSLNNEEIVLPSDGGEIWDAMYIKDVLNCCKKCLNYSQDIPFKIFNVGYGKEGIKMKELVGKIIEFTNSKKNPIYGNESANLKFLYNINKAKKELGYNPKDLEGSLEDYIKIEKENLIKKKENLIKKKENFKKILVSPNITIKNAMRIIDDVGRKIVIVVNEKNQLLGVVSDSDIRKGILNGIEIDEHVFKIINKNPVYAYTNSSEDDLLETFKNEKIRDLGLPIIDKNKVVQDFIFLSDKSEMKHLCGLEKTEKDSSNLRRILVIGGAGYIGSILVRKLLKKGYEVVVLDKFIYGRESLEEIKENPNLKIIEGDTRHIEDITLAVKDVDAVVHLAELVGDPACALNPQETQEINYLATKNIASVCKRFQINRMIYISSCSVYGASEGEELLSEKSPLNPVSLYAKMKIASENALNEMKDDNFAPIILRLGTVFGFSHRPRFDLVVNLLTAKAIKENKITIFGGKQWRPNVHISDVADTIISVLEAPIKNIRGKIFNVGSEKNNYTINEIGQIIKKIVPSSELSIEKNGDERDYKIDFSRLKKELDIKIEKSVEDGVIEIKKFFNENPSLEYKNPKYSNFLYLKENINSKKRKSFFYSS